jgi:hypothetical protein
VTRRSSWRIELTLLTPWVRRLAGRDRCEGYRWSDMSLRASRDPELREHFRCKSPARYRYVATRGTLSGRSGSYCWSHLHQQLMNMAELDRLETWVEEHLDEVNALLERYDQKPFRSRADADAELDAASRD